MTNSLTMALEKVHSLPAHGRATWQFGRNEQRAGGANRSGIKIHRNKIVNDLGHYIPDVIAIDDSLSLVSPVRTSPRS
jgi:hypothetical protein